LIYEIKKYPNPILRKKASEVKKIDNKIKMIALNMVETLNAYNGIGLAGNQVGILKRIIVIRTKDAPFIIINPKITRTSGTEEIEEGCLSFPGLFNIIKRSVCIGFKGLDINGLAIQGNVEGLIARAIQHEIDHIDGILFIDRMNKDERKRVLPEWRKIRSD